MHSISKTLCGAAAAGLIALGAGTAPAAAAVKSSAPAVSSPTGYAPLANLPIGAEGPAFKKHKVKHVKVARRRWRRRRGRRIGAAIGAGIVGGIILNEIARSNRRYYYDDAYYYAPRYRRPYRSCRQMKRACKRGFRRACYRWDRLCQ